MDIQTAYAQELKDAAERRKDRLMRAAATMLAAIPVGFPDAENVAIRRTVKLEKLLNDWLGAYGTTTTA